MRRALIAACVLGCLGGSARAASVAECRASTTPDALLKDPRDPELYDYAACAELVSGRDDLCDAFPGGPAASVPADLKHEVVRSDGKVHLDSLYGVCYSRAAAYRLLSLMVKGAPPAELRAQVKFMLHDEELPVDEILRAMLDAYRRGTLAGSPRPDLARIGFFTHFMGRAACARIELKGLRRECEKKAAALEAIKAKDSARCQGGDFLCRALLEGPKVCKEIGARIVKRWCERPPSENPKRPST